MRLNSVRTTLNLVIYAFLLASPTSAQSCPALSNITTPSLNLTTISASNGSSILECWSLPGFQASSTAGTSGALNLFLGSTSNASYTVIPPRFNGGVHNAPSAQIVVFLSGLIHVTLPNVTASPTTEAWIQGGKYATILAVDTADVSKYGHITSYLSDADTVTLQIPFAGGEVPIHEVLYEGPCAWSEMVGV